MIHVRFELMWKLQSSTWQQSIGVFIKRCFFASSLIQFSPVMLLCTNHSNDFHSKTMDWFLHNSKTEQKWDNDIFVILLKILRTCTEWKVSVFGDFLVGIFPHSDWIRRDTPFLSVFSPNAGKYGPEKLWIQTFFTQR